MSRLLGGGLNPNTAPLYQWGSGSNPLRVVGMAFGNGGHLMYKTADPTDPVIPKAIGHIVNATTTTPNATKIGLPYVGAGPTFGYANQVDRVIPGTTYEAVENGNIPWDGTINITDNSLGVLEANTTLYSETFRVPLDSTDGVSYPTNTEVQFKATLPAANLNYTGQWGFSAQAANLVSELALITGETPSSTTQIYSSDGLQPSNAGGYTYTTGAGNASNWGPGGGVGNYWTSKDGNSDTTIGPATSIRFKKTRPSTVTNGVDTFAANYNTWNMVARKVIPAIPKTSSFSLVFVWTVGF